MTSPQPKHPPADYIDGRWEPLHGHAIRSHNPARPDEIVWEATPRVENIARAVVAARTAFPQWAALTHDERVRYLRRYQDETRNRKRELAELITDESGKTLAESNAEVAALIAKVDITLEPSGSWKRITDFTVPVTETRQGHNRFKPHGVMAVIGPFNFPAHLPNGHFIPALAAGNTIVFKPSEKTPAVGQALAALWDEVGLPPGVFNLVHGAGDIAARLVSDDDIDGILFTGSWPVGRKILEANLDRPGRMIALEMGGNNAAVVMPDAHLRQAVIECVRAAFATTGQRCTCTRRIIVHEPIAERFLNAFVKAAQTITIGDGRSEPPVFMGPLINETAVEGVLAFQRRLVERGGKVLLEARRIAPGLPGVEASRAGSAADRPASPPGKPGAMCGHFITPGVIRVEPQALKPGDPEHDCEVFGPLVQISTCRNLDDAIHQANATQYGLAASIFTTDRDSAERFFREVRAGCINWNTGTAGASSKLAFGGLGRSGNHRPAGAFSVDYCAYPVAAMVEESDGADVPAGMQFDDGWL